jgi:DNA gyrase subunit B
MPHLIDAGHVFIAKPPLYKVRAGGKDVYIEKEAELEELLLRDKLEKILAFDRTGKQFKLTQPRWQKYVRQLKQYEGWAAALRAEHGHDTITFLEESQLLDEGVETADAAVKLLRKPSPEGEPYEASLLSDDPVALAVRAVERSTGAAITYRLRRQLFDSEEYRNLLRVHRDLSGMAGTPPFEVRLDEKREQARSFEALRTTVLDIAKKGVHLQRFKGLGEMNADQLYETTMDPARRTLQQVTIEDASAADEIFSMLMGDKVEPRRDFIERHAREVTNLDV